METVKEESFLGVYLKDLKRMVYLPTQGCSKGSLDLKVIYLTNSNYIWMIYMDIYGKIYPYIYIYMDDYHH